MMSRKTLKYIYLALKLVVGGFGIWVAWQAFGDKPAADAEMYRHAFSLGEVRYEMPLPEHFVAETRDGDTVIFLLPDRRNGPRLTLSARPLGTAEDFTETKDLREGRRLHYSTEILPNGNGPQHEQIRGRLDMGDGGQVLYIQADDFAELDAPQAEALLRYLHLLKPVFR